MNNQRVQRQVLAILDANKLVWTETPTGGMYLRFGSAGITIRLDGLGKQTLIQINSHVLVGIKGKTKSILTTINDLNMKSHFGRWIYDRDTSTIIVDYDLLGDDLQENELLTPLLTLARLADHYDDVLQRTLGGVRAFED